MAAVLSKMTGDLDDVTMWSERFASVADLYLPVNLHSCGSDEVNNLVSFVDRNVKIA